MLYKHFKIYNNGFILDNTGGKTKQEIMLEKLVMKEETFSIKEEILPGSTVEDTCTVYVQGESIKREISDIKSKDDIDLFELIFFAFKTLSNLS